jgi:hypothetical protein
MGNPGNTLSIPIYMDYAYENGNYYAFVINNSPGGLVRLDFGNSLLNTPAATYLGNFGGQVPNTATGIQMVKNNGAWYAIILGGDPTSIPSIPARILKLDFGANPANPSPVVTNWGNIGGMSYPHDLYLFQDAAYNWYGFTVNNTNNTLTKFSFGSNFNNPPTGTNLGNLGVLNGPAGMFPINDNGVWRIFITNFQGNSISRIDFGNSLLNAPSNAVNLGNPGGLLNNPRDLQLFLFCGQVTGLVGNNNGTIVHLDFNTLASVPTAKSLGNISNGASLTSISRMFRSGSDVYAFAPAFNKNTLERIKIIGCTNANLASSSLANPPSISYGAPGVYTINLTIDDGLPTQSAACRQVVVLAPAAFLVTKDTSICTRGFSTINSGRSEGIYVDANCRFISYQHQQSESGAIGHHNLCGSCYS